MMKLRHLVAAGCFWLGFCPFHGGQAAGPPPFIVVQPSDQAVRKGGTATFSVTAASVTTMSYQWYLGSTSIRNATSSTLTITNASPSNKGGYKVTVKNAGGTVTSQAATLTILNTPPIALADSHIVAQNVPLAVPPYGVLNNDFDADGQTLSASVVTEPLYGALVLNADGGFTYSPSSGYEGPDSFKYRAWDGAAYSEAAKVSLTVVCPPSINLQPSNQVVYAGQNFCLAAGANGSEPMTYQWHRNNAALTGATSPVLCLTNALPGWSGDRFALVIQNPGGSATSIVAELTVLDTTLRLRQAWVRRYNGSANSEDFTCAVSIDPQGNVCQTGYAKESASGSLDFVTLKYDRGGNLLWRAAYDGGNGDDRPAGIATDADGNVYVTGASKGVGSAWDYATVKYDPDGNQLWVARYNGVVNKDDLPSSICVRSDGTAVVTGASKGEGDRFTFVTIAYDSMGKQAWLGIYAAPQSVDDRGISIASDPAGNVYVTGQSTGEGTDYDYATVKYGPDGETMWVRRYDGPGNGPDIPAKVLASDDGTVTVTGSSKNATGNQDYLTIQYGSDGEQLWTARYDGVPKQDDLATSMVLDGDRNVIVTGQSGSPASKRDFATVKYGPAGQQLWASRYDGGDEDAAVALAVDRQSDVYVVGKSKNSAGLDIATIKLKGNNGEISASAVYNSGGNLTDLPVAVAVDSQFAVYVAGHGFSPTDYVLIQYEPSFLPPAIGNVAASSIELDSAALSAVVDSNGSRTSCYFRYGTTTNYGIATPWTTLPPGVSAVSASLTGLESGTWYYYSLVSSNTAGTATSEGAFATKVGFPAGSTLAATLKTANVGGSVERHMQLQFSGSPGLTCMVQTSTNMVDWASAGPATEVSPGVYEFVDPAPATSPKCFYRLRSP